MAEILPIRRKTLYNQSNILTLIATWCSSDWLNDLT